MAAVTAIIDVRIKIRISERRRPRDREYLVNYINR